MTRGAYTKPKIAAKTTFRGPVIPAYTTEEITEPIFQPMGPRIKCAAMTARVRLKKGTKIIDTTGGMIFRKNFSR